MEKLVRRIQTCQVCHAAKVKPRKLRCLHSFCEDCIGAYICSHQGQSSYPCPICRYDTKFDQPSETKTAIEIIKSLCEDNLNDKLWNSFEYNKFVPGNIKPKKLCNNCNVATTVEKFCLKCCEFVCRRCSQLKIHISCPIVHLREQERIEHASRRENETVSKETNTCMENLNTFRNALLLKVENMYSGKEINDKEISDYFIDLRKNVNNNLFEQEQKTVQFIQQVTNQNEETLRKGEEHFNAAYHNVQLKINLVQHLIGNLNGDLLISNSRLVNMLCIELEKQMKDVCDMISEQIGCNEQDNLAQMIYCNKEIDTKLDQSDLVDIELMESCHANPVSSRYIDDQIPNHPIQRVPNASNGGAQRDQRRSASAEANGNDIPLASFGESSGAEHSGPVPDDDREARHIRRTLRGMSLRRKRLLPPAPPIQTRVNQENAAIRQTVPQENITSGIGDITFVYKSNFKNPKDTRTPGPVEMASIGHGIFVVADRWNRAIKIVDTKQNYCEIDSFTLNSEPWGVAFTTNAFVVTCPNERKIFELTFDKMSNKTGITKRLDVAVGLASISYFRRHAQFICSVCPPFGEAEVNILNKYGKILQVVKTDQSNKQLFSYPRCLTVTDSGLITVVDMTTKRTSFLHYDETSSSVIKHFEGTDDIAIPVSSTVIPRKALVAVLYKSGALVVFSYDGQIVAIFDGKVTYPNPKCICVSVADSNAMVLCVGHMDGVLTFYVIKQDETPNILIPAAENAVEFPPETVRVSQNASNRQKTFYPLSDFNISLPSDQRTPCAVGMACIGLRTFIVADRWNKSIKLVDPDEEEKVRISYVLDSEPWDVTHVAGSTFVVTCPNEKKLIEIQCDRRSKTFYFIKRIHVPVGFAGVKYGRQQDRFVCSVCPPFGNAQINILSRRGQVLQVVIKDSLNKPLFSYPRSIALSESGFLTVVDMNLKKVLFFRSGEITTTEIGTFKGHDELAVPESSVIIPNDELVVVLFKSGTVVSFSFEGEVVNVFEGASIRTNPKCIAIDTLVDELCVCHSDGVVGHYKIETVL